RPPRSSSAGPTTATASAGTSDAATLPTPPAIPSSSIGAPTSPAPSTARPEPSRWVSSGGVASASSRGASPPTRTSTSPTRRRRSGVIPVRGTDPVDRAALKGDARMAQVVHAAAWAHLPLPDEALVLPRGSRKWRLPAYQVRDIVAELRLRGPRYAAARDMLAQ